MYQHEATYEILSGPLVATGHGEGRSKRPSETRTATIPIRRFFGETQWATTGVIFHAAALGCLRYKFLGLIDVTQPMDKESNDVVSFLRKRGRVAIRKAHPCCTLAPANDINLIVLHELYWTAQAVSTIREIIIESGNCPQHVEVKAYVKSTEFRRNIETIKVTAIFGKNYQDLLKTFWGERHIDADTDELRNIRLKASGYQVELKG